MGALVLFNCACTDVVRLDERERPMLFFSACWALLVVLQPVLIRCRAPGPLPCLVVTRPSSYRCDYESQPEFSPEPLNMRVHVEDDSEGEAEMLCLCQGWTEGQVA